MMSESLRITLWLSSVVVCSMLLVSCESAPRQTPARGGLTGAHQPAANEFSGRDLIDRSAHVRVTNTVVRAEVMPLFGVPFDNMSMPLVSPDGQFLATQTNISPTWPTILAEDDAQVPWATRIEIYRLPLDGAAHPSSKSPDFVAELTEPAILGRSFDDRGFLIESPREDGSRWIGLASWDSGEIEWLVADERVNAFPAIGPEGRLAWARRTVGDSHGHFELVVRLRGQEERSYGSESESWLLPTWSGRDDRLFAMALRGGELFAMHALAGDDRTFMQSRLYLPLTGNADVFTAYQTIGAQVAPAWRADAAEQLLIFHPSARRMALWRPQARGQRAGSGLVMLESNSFAAVIDEHDRAMVTLDRHLVAQRLDTHTDVAMVMAGTQIVRATRSASWPYVLLEPGDSVVGVIAYRPGAADSLATR
jgi:hypothetical protein